jgi:hypothetical protein
VSAKGFGERHAEHLKEAKKEAFTANNFYSSYPTKCNPRAKKSKSVLGYFDSLTLVIAAGFDPKSELAALIDKDFNEGGIMIMSDADKTNISSSMKQNNCTLNKYHTFLSYLFKLGYDLAIAPSSNVSDSFGFESFVGLFNTA